MVLTEPRKWTGRIYPVWGRFFPDRMKPMNFESNGTDGFMNRTEPMNWTGQIVPRPGRYFPDRTEPMNL